MLNENTITMINTLNYKRMMRATLLVLLMSVVGLFKGYAQEGFTVDGLHYTINDDGVSVTVLGEFGEDYYPLVIPESVNYDGVDYAVTAISDFAFSWIGIGGELVIPNSIVTIGDFAFEGCTDLTGLTLGESVVEIGRYAFADCYGCEGDLVIPNSVVSIGEGAFDGCYKFTGLTIGNSVTTIGYDAFGGCFSLMGALVIPNSVVAIDENPFWGCAGIDQMTVESGNTVYDSRDNCNAIIETATNTMIAGCSNSVIPNTVVSIGDHAFDACGIASVVIPNSVVSLGNSAFSFCLNLNSIVIPSSVTTIGKEVIAGCLYLEQVIVEDDNPVYDSRDHCNAIIETATNVLLSGCKNTVIPNSVTEIGEYAFISCYRLTSIFIPLSVTKIDHHAFKNSGLTGGLVIPNSVVSIEENAFFGCNNLDGCLTLGSSLTQIGYNAFCGCMSLKNVIVLASTPPALEDGTFGYIELDQLVVTCGNKDVYEASDWADCFIAIEEDCSTYSVAVEENAMGTIEVSANQAPLGEEIMVSCTPASGNELVQIIVCKADDAEQLVPVYAISNQGSMFVMPNYDVIAKAVISGYSVGEENMGAMLVYPNPTDGIVKIETENLRYVSVFNAVGQKVYEEQVNGNELEINLGSQEAGVYLIRLETATGVAIKRVVLTK